MDLERELGLLELEWPATPSFRLELAPRARRPRPILVGLAVAVVVALAASFAVPQSRGDILRFLHLGGVTVRFVQTLPPAEERPLGADLGPVVPLDAARRAVPRLLVPPLDDVPALHQRNSAISLVFRYRGETVLLSEFPGGSAVLKKIAGTETRVEYLRVGKGFGAWISGSRHVVLFAPVPARLAGNVLIWAIGSTTYRLEGPSLTRDGAVELGESLRTNG